jgi:integrase
MANKHPGLSKVGDFWHYSLKINGARLHGSTKATDLPTARRVLEEKRRHLIEGQCGMKQAPSLSDVRKEWLEAHRAVYSQKHCQEVESVTRNWILPALGSRRVDKVVTEDVQSLRAKMVDAGRSPVTVNDMMKILKLLLKFAVKRGHLKQVSAQFDFLRVQKKPRPTLSCSNVKVFLEALDRATSNPQIAVILRVMIGLGLREAEALGMRWEWFDPQNQTYTVGKAKGKEARVLPVPSWLWNAIHAMPMALSDWVFPAKDGKPHRAQFCKKVLQRVCGDLGLVNLTHHRLRATFATLHAGSGTPITEIQGMLGHKNIQTTMIYVETSLDAKRRAQDALSLHLGLA